MWVITGQRWFYSAFRAQFLYPSLSRTRPQNRKGTGNCSDPLPDDWSKCGRVTNPIFLDTAILDSADSRTA